MTTPLPIFLHIPKTAGTTFRSVISSQYPQERLCYIYPTGRFPNGTRYLNREQAEALPSEQLERYDIVSGHLSYGVHQLFPGRPAVYCSVLRDPVQRVVSLYNHQKTSNRLAAGLSLVDILRQASNKPWQQFSNNQVKCLAGVAKGPAAPTTEITEQTLQTALDNVERHFAFVGLTERFDETLVLAARTFGWKEPAYLARNIRRSGASWEVSDEALDLIHRTNALDLQLYAALAKRFDALLAAQGAEFRQDLARLKERCLALANARGAQPEPARGRGMLGKLSRGRIAGWAMLPERSTPASVRLLINGREAGTQTADRLRKGLLERGVHPTGKCGFAFDLPGGRELRVGDEVRVCFANSEFDLQNSPRVYQGES